MKYLDEYRDADAVRRLAAAIRAATTRPWNIMEICGGQTHAIIRFALDEMLPREITLIHGPGCPVCVTPIEIIDKAVAIAARPEVIFCSFGDMLRVPGSQKDLLTVKSEGGDVRIVYSPMDAVALAQKHPERQVVFFAVGFETTAPANAMAVAQAARLGLENFSVLVSHVLVPPAIRAVLGSPANRVQGFLAAGHVCTITGMDEYRPDRRDVSRADRGHRLRAGGHPAGRADVRRATRSGPARGREPIRPQRSARGQPRGPAADGRGLRDRAAKVARHRRDSRQRPGPARRVRRSSTPSGVSTWKRSRPKSRPSASPARFCRATRSRTTARRSASTARPSGRSARRWFPPKGPARRIIAIDDTSLNSHHPSSPLSRKRERGRG